MALGSFAQSARAAERPILTIDSALTAAFSRNPDLAAVGWNSAIAQGERLQAGLMPNPEVSWDTEDTRSNTRTSSVKITQPIELGGKRGARIDVAEGAQDAAALELDRQRNALRGDVIEAFYGALRAQQRVQLAQQSLSLTERAVAVADGQIRAGKSSPVEATRAQVQLAEARLEMRRAEMEQVNVYQQLAVIMGDARPQFAKVQGDTKQLARLPTAAVLLGRLPATVELRLAALQIDQSEAALALEKTQRVPDLNVSVGSQYSAESRERVNLVGFSMAIPLFNRNQGNVLAAARRADQARDLRNANELRLRAEVLQALAQWRTALGEVQSFGTTILPAAESAVSSALRGFAMGKFNFLDVLDAQRTLIGARTQYIQAIAAATSAWVQIERTFGDTNELSGDQ
ncbi:MAG: TolC family protein [Pseudomonas sp.]|uniref:TolC family protein n=1 Tax=Pseudomonas sp. TaxID=306 RepID=UPI003BB7CEC6